jgi:hypothetical protein
MNKVVSPLANNTNKNSGGPKKNKKKKMMSLNGTEFK